MSQEETMEEKKENMNYIDIAEKWLKEHYPKTEIIDIRWSAVLNFALFLEEQMKQKGNV